MIYLLLNGDSQDPAILEAVEASGLQLDGTLTWPDLGPKINTWGVRFVPALVKIHDGVAVDQIAADWIQGKSASTIKGRFTNAVKAYDAAKAQQP